MTESRHSAGTVKAGTTMIARNDAGASGTAKRPSDVLTDGHPRLMSLTRGSKYLGVSYWLLRDWVASGILQPVKLPGSRLKKNGRVVSSSKHHTMRKIMVDRFDLDKLIENCK